MLSRSFVTRSLLSAVVLSAAVLTVAPSCYDDSSSDDYYYDTGYSSGGGSGSSSYHYTYTCPSGTTATVEIADDGCASANERYAEVFGCNDIDNMFSACANRYRCYGQDDSHCYAYAR